ncbi:MAG: C-methyltransferase [Phycisphaerales bacterium]|nr:C-methyltransferase [Phycisphaerales bacterium]
MTNSLPPRVSFPQDRLPEHACPACGAPTLRTFYAVRGVPVRSNVLIDHVADSEAFPTGDVVLAQCDTCAFITNTAFDESRLMISQAREASQSCSLTSCDFTKQLAARWIERYDLRGKTLIEIGCGQGEFLESLCELAGARGVGFDPVVRRDRSKVADAIFVAGPVEDFVDRVRGDFIFCRHTLDHIAEPLKFLSLLRPAAENTPVLFEVPDNARVMVEGAFWDIGYEHSSYFSSASLTRVFQRAGFEVTRTTLEFDNQWLVLEAAAEPVGGQKRDMPSLSELRSATHFVRIATAKMNHWLTFAAEAKRQKRKCVIWGGGSKAVGFLTTLGIEGEFECVIDIDLAKQGSYLPGTRLRIEPPAALMTVRPDVVLITNPGDRDAIAMDLAAMGLTPEISTL